MGSRTPSDIDCEIESTEITSHLGEANTEINQDPNVAVIAGRTMKPQPPNGFRKAAEDSDWYCALGERDCKALMELLQESPCLVVQTGYEGRTVLHAAAERGCLQLLDQVFDLFKDQKKFVDVQSGVMIKLDDFCKARMDRSKARAVDYARFSCSEDVCERLKLPYAYINMPSFSSEQKSNSDARQHLLGIMNDESTNELFKSLEEYYEKDRDYNFVLDRKELKFHYAIGRITPVGSDKHLNYVRSIIEECLNLGEMRSVEVLTYLFRLRNAQGRTPLHLMGRYSRFHKEIFRKRIPGDMYKQCLNATDVRGWTPFHHASVTDRHYFLRKFLEDERIDPNIRIPNEMGFGATALHLAILHKNVKCVELLLECPRTDVNAIVRRRIVCGYERWRPSFDLWDCTMNSLYWSPLQLAAIMGLSNVVRILLISENLQRIFDCGKDFNSVEVTCKLDKKFQRIPALLLASASRNPDTLRLFLDNSMINPLVKSNHGATALHYATNAMMPYTMKMFSDRYPIVSSDGQEARFLNIADISCITYDWSFATELEEDMFEQKTTTTSYLGNQACITMLLQAGVDIWEKDDNQMFAEPGPLAPKEAHLWWHDRIARETFEAKKSLNDAANAISVVAALVATASFVGPLQPPLSYGQVDLSPDLHLVQNTRLSIRVFMVSNSLSFYFANASIMFAVVPSLPMPQEGIYAEWQRTRRTVAMAIFFLLMSVLGVLISFGAASNSVVSEEYSWKHSGLSFYPAVMGGLICLIRIILFFLRLLRLVFNRNEKIRYLYRTFVKF